MDSNTAKKVRTNSSKKNIRGSFELLFVDMSMSTLTVDDVDEVLERLVGMVGGTHVETAT